MERKIFTDQSGFKNNAIGMLHSDDPVRGDLLTPTESAIFTFLAEHQNHVVSRAMIHDRVWKLNRTSFSNTVDVHIKNLRKKIATSIGKNNLLIETVWGHGYRLRVR